ncbi:MAG: serine/threonine-protein phosphatase [Gemmatimonadaceae bacterium]|nr:serine/threonine-protein phosphatase [Gemmatimonadaceae bacterium]
MQTSPAAPPTETRKPRDDEIDIHGLTHVGKVRDDNQDHFLICSLRKHLDVHSTSLPADELAGVKTDRLAFIAMVADGVGGGVGGEEASRFALRAVSEYVTQSAHCYYTADASDDEAFRETLEEAATRVHEALQRASEGRTRATTLSLLLGVWPRLYLLQVGDSRYYLWRDRRLTQVSRDQTIAQDLIDAGVLRRGDRLGRLANTLSSAIGGPTSRPEVTAVENSWGCVHLLCSDGLTKHVSDERIAEVLSTMTSARQACEQLLAEALGAGGTDNITILVGRTLRHGA